MIFLIGMPAAGKTYWGEILSGACGLSFVDMDHYLEEQEGMSVSTMFAEDGEEVFRQKETAVLKELVEQKRYEIIACGGGTPVYNNNLQFMKEHGCVVYLEAGIDVLVSRLKNNKDRPLLQTGTNMQDTLQALFNKRRQFYEMADYIVDEEQVRLDSFKNIVDLCTKKH